MRYKIKYIVSDRYRFVYFVVQKVACTSVKTALAPLFGMDAAVPEKSREEKGMRYVVHGFFDGSENQIGKESFVENAGGSYSDYFKFAFVRNPYDRLASCYSDKILGGRRNFIAPKNSPASFYEGMPFGEFVEAVCAIPDEQANPHFRSQHVTVCGPGGEVMADFLGRFESMTKDFRTVAEKIGARDLDLPHLQQAGDRTARSYRDLYDARTRALVADRYAKDLETFGYAF